MKPTQPIKTPKTGTHLYANTSPVHRSLYFCSSVAYNWSQQYTRAVFLNLFCYAAPLVSHSLFGGTPRWQNRSKDQWISIFFAAPLSLSHGTLVENHCTRVSISGHLISRPYRYRAEALSQYGGPVIGPHSLSGRIRYRAALVIGPHSLSGQTNAKYFIVFNP